MTEIYPILAVLGIAFMLSLTSIPIFRLLGSRWRPEGAANVHGPRLSRRVSGAGGAAVFFAVSVSILAMIQADFDWGGLPHAKPLLLSLFGGCLVLFCLGLGHDLFELKGRYRLLGELTAITILVGYGHLSIHKLYLFGTQIELGWFGIALTYLWLIAIINAIDLLDGMDGLLGLIGVIVCLSFSIMAVLAGNPYAALVSAALGGALIGLLCFNLPPAVVRLGCGGNMFVGLILGALSIQGSMKGPTAITLAVPMTVLILPVLDMAAGFARRKLTGRSIYSVDSGHLHHCLLRSGMRPMAVLGMVGGLGLIASAGAVATTVLHHDLYAIGAAALVVAVLIASRLFGHHEVKLMRAKLKAFVRLVANRKNPGHAYQLEVRLQGKFDWQDVWQELTAAARECQFETLCLDVNAPLLREGYHARWDRLSLKTTGENCRDWSVQSAIRLQGSAIGRLSATGVCGAEPIWVKLGQFAEIVKVAELHVHRLTERLTTANSPFAPAVATG